MNVAVIGTGYAGTIIASNVTFTLIPTDVGSQVTVPGTSVQVGPGSQRTVNFTVPAPSPNTTSPRAYRLTIAGKNTNNVPFQSLNDFPFTLNPKPTLVSVSPGSAQRSQTLLVTITGSSTNFQTGITRASFGPDISVAGAAPGALGPISVISATQAVAEITVGTSAALGPRTVATQGIESVSLPNGFVVSPVPSTRPLSCEFVSAVPPLLRAEGLIERIGDLQLVCSGGVEGTSVTVNVQLFLNTPITGAPSEALLIVSDRAYPAQSGSAVNSIVWTGVEIVAPGTGQTILSVRNVFANAATLGASQGVIPNQVVAFLSISPSQSLALSAPQQIVGYVQRGQTFDLTNCAGESSGAPILPTCLGSQGTVSFGVRFREGFQTAFEPGVRLVARFVDVPAGVSLFVTRGTITGTSPSASANLAPETTPTAALVCPITSTSYPAVPVSLINGRADVFWEITAANPSILEQLVFGVGVVFSSGNASPGSGLIAGGFAPFTPPTPRFIEPPEPTPAFFLRSCRTTLLFPFVTARAGFDTGVAISNTSSPQQPESGICSLHYFGETNLTVQTTNAAIRSGETAVFVLSSGGNFGIIGTPGFQGYLFAQCDFRFAHGFAFLTDGPIGTAAVAEGYLALVPDREPTNQTVEMLGH